MAGDCSVGVTLKEHVESFLLVGADIVAQTLHSDLTSCRACVFLNCDVSTLLMGRDWTQKIEHQLVINLDIRHTNSNLLVELGSNFLEHL